jgi:hypothetical protein
VVGRTKVYILISFSKTIYGVYSETEVVVNVGTVLLCGDVPVQTAGVMHVSLVISGG